MVVVAYTVSLFWSNFEQWLVLLCAGLTGSLTFIHRIIGFRIRVLLWALRPVHSEREKDDCLRMVSTGPLRSNLKPRSKSYPTNLDYDYVSRFFLSLVYGAAAAANLKYATVNTLNHVLSMIWSSHERSILVPMLALVLFVGWKENQSWEGWNPKFGTFYETHRTTVPINKYVCKVRYCTVPTDKTITDHTIASPHRHKQLLV